MLKDTLNKLKDEKGLTAQELSQASGVPLTTVNRILSGQTPDPAYSTVCRLLDVLGADKSTRADGFETDVENPPHYEQMISLYERGIAHRNKWIKVLAGIIIVVFAIILTLLLVDILNPNIGYLRH